MPDKSVYVVAADLTQEAADERNIFVQPPYILRRLCAAKARQIRYDHIVVFRKSCLQPTESGSPVAPTMQQDNRLTLTAALVCRKQPINNNLHEHNYTRATRKRRGSYACEALSRTWMRFCSSVVEIVWAGMAIGVCRPQSV